MARIGAIEVPVAVALQVAAPDHWIPVGEPFERRRLQREVGPR
jgi:hypothetical protein